MWDARKTDMLSSQNFFSKLCFLLCDLPSQYISDHGFQHALCPPSEKSTQLPMSCVLCFISVFDSEWQFSFIYFLILQLAVIGSCCPLPHTVTCHTVCLCLIKRLHDIPPHLVEPNSLPNFTFKNKGTRYWLVYNFTSAPALWRLVSSFSLLSNWIHISWNWLWIMIQGCCKFWSHLWLLFPVFLFCVFLKKYTRL